MNAGNVATVIVAPRMGRLRPTWHAVGPDGRNYTNHDREDLMSMMKRRYAGMTLVFRAVTR